jgi:hypothetical protein
MCRVGKFQKKWKLQETNSCPLCGQFEDALHVWKCHAQPVQDLWNNSLTKLQSHLRKLDTDPDLIKLLWAYLDAWRYDQTDQTLINNKYGLPADLQDTTGGRQFFEGWLHYEWESLQEKCYLEINSRRSNKRWTVAVITKLWDVAWDLWDLQNAVYHNQTNRSLQEDTHSLDLQVRDIIQQISLIGLLPKDRHLATISLTRLLCFPRSQKIEWIQQTNLALAQAKQRPFQVRRSRQVQHRRHQTMLASMQRSLRNWLDSL